MTPAGFPRVLHKRPVQLDAVTVLQSGTPRSNASPDPALESGCRFGNQTKRLRLIDCVSDGRFRRQLHCFQGLGSRLGVDDFDSNHDAPVEDDG